MYIYIYVHVTKIIHKHTLDYKMVLETNQMPAVLARSYGLDTVLFHMPQTHKFP